MKIDRCFVYIIGVGDEDGPFEKPIKIGMTSKPTARIATIRACSPYGVSYVFVLEVAGRVSARNIEKKMHEAFDRRRLAYEWFDVDPNEATNLLKSLNPKGV